MIDTPGNSPTNVFRPIFRISQSTQLMRNRYIYMGIFSLMITIFGCSWQSKKADQRHTNKKDYSNKPNSAISNFQDIKMTHEVEEIIKLGKDSIVQLALEIMDNRIETQNFEIIKVMTNGKEVYVSFRNPIKYLPAKSSSYFDVEVNIVSKTAGYDCIANDTDNYPEDTIEFYKPTVETNKNIQFVIESINQSTEVGSFVKANFEDNMIIREHDNYYDISIVSGSQESSYKIEKATGKIYDAMHAHLIPPPFENQDLDIWKEIN